MNARTFVDTNILLYAHTQSGGRKRAIASAALQTLWEEGSGVISTQVLQEFYVNLTRKLRPAVPPMVACDLVTQYTRWQVMTIEPDDVIAAIRLEREAMLSFWDALIVIAAAKAGAERLLSEDFNPGQSLLGVRIDNPFGTV